MIGKEIVTAGESDVVFVKNIENRIFLQTDEIKGLKAEVFSFTPVVFGSSSVCSRLFFSAGRKPPIVRAFDRGAAFIETQLDLLRDTLMSGFAGEETTVLVSSLICAVCAYTALLLGNGTMPASYNVTESPAAVSSAIQYVNAHIAEPFDVSDVASAVFMSRGYFTDYFNRYVGVTPAVYIRRMRVNNALRLLTAGKMTVLEAAFASGFTSSSGFYKAFASVYGMNPSAYLRTLSAEVSSGNDQGE